ncbi:hypothetical protein [Massilia sp. NP310]|uniref:hypothetical protein n=1 Tax=Massilia sp. NP310 TaxID=2861282 RepID=UPI001C62A179|nr:hypothetical protein [Massilia sp. NP310]QYG03855.1 hypothetical protein KY496_10980 [Massilia sp. NP310]
MEHIETPSRRKLLAAALEHLALERAAACVIQVPDTDPPLFVAVGPAPTITKLLQDEAHQRKHAALQELVDIAQENDMGYGAPKKVAADVEFDESEGGHHD